MYNNDRIYITPKELLDYEFPISVRGYNPEEVDKVLDMVIRDITEYIKIIKKLDREIEDLTEDNSKLKAELRKWKNVVEAAEKEEVLDKPSNIDLLKRISNLEKIVYEKVE